MGKKKKELEEFRKLGAAPAEVDDEGFSINPHIPQYMAEAPWYLSNGRPGLRHQRIMTQQAKFAKCGDIIQRGFKYDDEGNLITNKRWTKGACENCGASTHKTKECVYRPRKKKAKYNPINIAPEEHIQLQDPNAQSYTFDGKRDRWNNYNIANHQLIIERHRKVEQFRRHKKAKELDQQILDEKAKKKLQKKAKKIKHKKKTKKDKSNTEDVDSSDVVSSDSDSDDSDDSDLDSDDGLKDKGEVIQRFDSKHRQTVRNLRIREDMPKYLRNLSTKSSFYDPKTRSMRANPYAGTDITDETYMGDNFIRNTGDAERFDSVNKFAWQCREINGKAATDAIHLQSNPTQTELAFKQFNSKKSSVEDKFKANLMNKYGGNEHALAPNADTMQVLYGQSESYREFGADGRVVKGQSELIPSSKYEEDVHPGNHASVWGSYYDVKQGKWGYACCHCLVYHAYCTGDDGIKAMKESKDSKEVMIGNKNKGNVESFGVVPRPKEMDDHTKLVNPSGYISTRGIMASKGIARKLQKQKELSILMKKRAKKKKKRKKKKSKKKKAESEVTFAPRKSNDGLMGAPMCFSWYPSSSHVN